MASVAVNEETATVKDVAVVGIVKALTTGTVVSGRVMATVSDRLEDTLPAASLAQAYAVLLPEPENVNEVGAAAVQPAAPATGAVAVFVIR